MRPTRGRPPSSSTRSSASRRREGHALEHRPRQGAAVVAQAEPGEGAAGARVGVRRALAGQVGREEQPLDPRLPLRRAAQQLVVGAPDRLAQPLQRAGRAEHHAHDVPRLRHGVAEGVHARLGVVRVAVQGGEDDAARAEHDGRRTALGHHADAERARGLVARAGGDRHAAVGHAGDGGRLVDLRQPRRVDVERADDLVAPAARGDVEEQRARGVGDVDGVLVGELEADVVLGQQDVGDAPVDLGLVLGQPQQLGRGEPGQRAVAGQLHEALEADAPLDLLALRLRAPVVPQDRGPQRARRRRRARRGRASGPTARCPQRWRRRAPRAPPPPRATSPRGPARSSRDAASTAGSRARRRPARRRRSSIAIPLTDEVPTSSPSRRVIRATVRERPARRRRARRRRRRPCAAAPRAGHRRRCAGRPRR